MGFKVESTHLNWKSVVDDGLWRDLLSAAGPPDGSSGGPSKDLPDEEVVVGVALGPVLPSGDESRVASLQVELDSTKGHMSWALLLYPAPEGEPPADVVEEDRRLGGQAGLRKLIRRGMAGAPAPTTLHLTLRLPGTEYETLLLSLPVDQIDSRASRLGAGAKREHVGYRISEGIAGLREVVITYDHNRDQVLVSLLAQIVWRPDENTFLKEDLDLGDLVVNTLFTRRADQ